MWEQKLLIRNQSSVITPCLCVSFFIQSHLFILNQRTCSSPNHPYVWYRTVKYVFCHSVSAEESLLRIYPESSLRKKWQGKWEACTKEISATDKHSFTGFKKQSLMYPDIGRDSNLKATASIFCRRSFV